jgi:hypothetical protein
MPPGDPSSGGVMKKRNPIWAELHAHLKDTIWKQIEKDRLAKERSLQSKPPCSISAKNSGCLVSE